MRNLHFIRELFYSSPCTSLQNVIFNRAHVRKHDLSRFYQRQLMSEL